MNGFKSTGDKAAVIQMALFCAVLTAFGGLLLFLPKKVLDTEENRSLSKVPEISIINVLSGNYMDSLDEYTADHFPFRKMFLNLTFQMKNLRGIPNREVTFHSGVQAIDEKIDVKENASLVKDEETKNSRGLLIVNGQGYQIFNPEKTESSAFASAINSYQDVFKDSISIYNLIVPSPVDFLLPSQYNEYKGIDYSTLNKMIQKTHVSVSNISVYEEFQKHKNEYLYFRTDHHWTALGAYYAYVAFCKKKGFVPVKLDSMPQKQVTGSFLGTHYLKTKDARLLENPDSIHYWVPFVEPKATKLNQSGTKLIDVFKTSQIDINKYLVFLGGDQPTMVLRSSKVKNGKTLLVIKNSYGNPLSPYFTNNYEIVLVMDYRYTKAKVRDLVKRYRVNDILIVNSIFSANAKSHLRKIKKIL